MDFFQNQDDARRRTRWMIVMFLISAVLVVASVDAVVFGVLCLVEPSTESGSHSYDGYGSYQPVYSGGAGTNISTQDSVGVLLVTSIITTLLIIIGTWYKIATLSAGGKAVAEMLGAKLISPTTANFAERRLLNIVEEMALASGVPVPPVYLMEEKCINAFAAGFTPEDAVVSVTRGALDTLTREELQGVVAHEFSHILNGDMRLNIRMMGVLNGILVISLIGQVVLRGMCYSGGSSDRDSGGVRVAIVLIALAIMIIGYVGWFLGHIIRMAVSRQREYLADASAVQFTRNPEGIGNALIKIGAISYKERPMTAAAADEVNHMFLASASGLLSWGLFETHPPLARRIKRILPDFNGKFSPISTLMKQRNAEEPATESTESQNPISQYAAQVAAAVAAVDETLTPELQQATSELLPAVALVYAALLEKVNQEVRAVQCQTLRSAIPPAVFAEFERAVASIASLPSSSVYLLVERALPTLKQLSEPQYEQFRQTMITLIKADGRVDLNEYTLQAKILRQLDVFHGFRKPTNIHFYRWEKNTQYQASVVLSRLAHDGNANPTEQSSAFRKGAETLGLSAVEMLSSETCGLKELSKALETLDGIAPPMKVQFLQACEACVMSDGQVVEKEKQLLHAIAGVLGVPCSLLNSQESAA